MGKLKSEVKNADIGFQIAPMIDIIFLLILYFMVQAGNNKTEMEIRSHIPARADYAQPESLQLLEENVVIDDQGVISHNDEVLDAGAPTTHVDNNSRVARPDLLELKNRMKRLAEQGNGPDGAGVLVTVSPHPETPYYRLTDVLNTLQFASIKNMTISVQDEF